MRLLALDRDETADLAERLGVSAEPARMAQDERVREALQAEVDEVNKRLACVEQIKLFAVLDRDLTQAAANSRQP